MVAGRFNILTPPLPPKIASIWFILSVFAIAQLANSFQIGLTSIVAAFAIGCWNAAAAAPRIARSSVLLTARCRDVVLDRVEVETQVGIIASRRVPDSLAPRH